jgi:hypothetical protein
LRNLEELLDGDMLAMNWALAVAGLFYLLAWAFLTGGVLDRYAHPELPRLRVRFFSHCGEYFPSLVQLLAVTMLLYWAAFRFVVRPLHDWVERLTLDVTVERTVILWTAGVYAVALLLLMLIGLLNDYAKISLVVEKRRGAISALAGSLRFLVQNSGKACLLFVLLSTMSLGVLLAYLAVAPGPGQASWATVFVALAISQIYLLARLLVKLWFLASQTALMQSSRVAPTAVIEPEAMPKAAD